MELDRREQAPLHKEGERTRHAQQVLSQRTRTPRVDLAGQVVRVCFSVQEGRKPKLSFQNHRGCYNKIEFLMLGGARANTRDQTAPGADRPRSWVSERQRRKAKPRISLSRKFLIGILFANKGDLILLPLMTDLGVLPFVSANQ
ncbi:hypothetical protein Lal_00042315 [Lupinus albus]|nr:hypothetical protein Lal_00042315 [Lupinus albus]